jgi:hypothetical protein
MKTRDLAEGRALLLQRGCKDAEVVTMLPLHYREKQSELHTQDQNKVQ